MASNTDLEWHIIDAAKKSLAADKDSARRARLLEAGFDLAEVDRRIAQSRASREAHLRLLADPARAAEFECLSKAQSDAARRMAGTVNRPKPDRTPECEARTLAFIRQHGPISALDIARGVSGDESATQSYINPTLYRLAAHGEVFNTERGWITNHTVLKTQILALLDDETYNALELCAVMGSDIERTKTALEEMVQDGSLALDYFATPSGEHAYYRKLCD